jgi:hypothetical protein
MSSILRQILDKYTKISRGITVIEKIKRKIAKIPDRAIFTNRSMPILPVEYKLKPLKD